MINLIIGLVIGILIGVYIPMGLTDFGLMNIQSENVFSTFHDGPLCRDLLIAFKANDIAIFTKATNYTDVEQFVGDRSCKIIVNDMHFDDGGLIRKANTSIWMMRDDYPTGMKIWI